MEFRGTVVSWKRGVARVRIAVSACAACGQNCAARSGDGGRYLLVRTATPVVPGQAVLVEANLPSPARAVALAYLLPLAGFMVGLFAGNAASGGSPLPALGAGLAGAAACYGVVALLERPRQALVRLATEPTDAVCPQQ